MFGFRWYSGLNRRLDAIPSRGVGAKRTDDKPSIWCRRVPECIMTPRWMGRAYFDPQRNEFVMVVWPLNYVVRGWWRLGWFWDRMRHRPSWIDCLVKKAFEDGVQAEVSRARRDWTR